MKRIVPALVLIALLAAAGAFAQTADADRTAGPAPARSSGMPPWGLRAGYTAWENVNQFHFGGHLKLGDVFPNVALTPGLEVGFGDDVTVLAVNGDLAYRVTELSEYPWGPYVGGSLSFIYVDADPFGSDTDLGLSLLGGTTYDLDGGNELLAEIRLGIMDAPGFKLTFGYTFF